MRWFNVLTGLVVLLVSVQIGMAEEFPISEATQECLDCHIAFHPGIVAGWEKSRHAQTTPAEAMKVKGLSRKVSAETIPDLLKSRVVGCAECHMMNSKTHGDTFEHNGNQVHVVVSPQDCATCHPKERQEYGENIMAHAYNNLAGNGFYQTLEQSIIGLPAVEKNRIVSSPGTKHARGETCYYCHGTQVTVTGMEIRDTDAGELKFPVLDGWPNQGVGRVNPDGSKGSCTPCHARHRFSMEMARKPDTCSECHMGPDVPAYKVYKASKHGNLYSSHNSSWDFNAVPWTVGKDFTAPTCAACHISLVVDTDGVTVAKRSHRMNDRLPWRLFGLIYAHPHPEHPDTSRIQNKAGVQLPTDFYGENAKSYLIDSDTQAQRTRTFQSLCLSCHGTTWVTGHWERLAHTILQTNAVTRTTTGLMQEIWDSGLAQGMDRGGNPFDEAIEKKWSDVWLIYANTIRFSAAMAGGGDYSVYANGYYQLSGTIKEMTDWYELRKALEAMKLDLQAPSRRGERSTSSAWHDE